MLWLLRRLGAGRRAAKAIYWLAGQASRIKTPHRMYTRNGPDQPTTFAGWRWSACNPSMRLLDLSMQLDWEHWDHWACLHDECGRGPCPECGGIACPTAEDFEDEEAEATQ